MKERYLTTEYPNIFFEDDKVGQLKKRLWDASEEEIQAILDDYGIGSDSEMGKHFFFADPITIGTNRIPTLLNLIHKTGDGLILQSFPAVLRYDERHAACVHRLLDEHIDCIRQRHSTILKKLFSLIFDFRIDSHLESRGLGSVHNVQILHNHPSLTTV